MTKKIVSFGDSFIFGSELQNNNDGSKAWPGLIANELECDYETFANPGCGNDNIAQQIYSYFSANSTDDTLAVINWTWATRWDFYITKEIIVAANDNELGEHISESNYGIVSGPSWPSYAEFLKGDRGTTPNVQAEIKHLIDNTKVRKNGMWAGLGPTCVPEKLSWLENSIEAKRIIDFYRDYGNNNVMWNKFRNLQTIFAVQSYLKQKNINAIQTYMDYELFDQTYSELTPNYVRELQSLVQTGVELFYDGLNFLDWAVEHDFPVTPAPGDHPLEEAHIEACIVWKERYRKHLFND